MDPYKLKHIPTGLYYQPVRGIGEKMTNLSYKRGKIYETNSNSLNGSGDHLWIKVSKKQHEEFKDYFDKLNSYISHDDSYNILCPKNDFKKEDIK